MDIEMKSPVGSVPKNGKLFTHAVTFSPREGVTDRQIWLLKRYLLAATVHHGMYAEATVGGKRHVHIADHRKNAISKGNLGNCYLNALSECDLSPAEKKVFRGGFYPWYSHDWVDGYIGPKNPEKQKDAFECISDTLPTDIGEMTQWYPPPGDRSLCKPVSVYFTGLEKRFLEDKITGYRHWLPDHFKDWLISHMCYYRDIESISDPRKLLQVATHLRLFILKSNPVLVHVTPQVSYSL